jgi:hypothetical protein
MKPPKDTTLKMSLVLPSLITQNYQKNLISVRFIPINQFYRIKNIPEPPAYKQNKNHQNYLKQNIITIIRGKKLWRKKLKQDRLE